MSITGCCSWWVFVVSDMSVTLTIKVGIRDRVWESKALKTEWFPKLWKLQHVGIINDQLCLSTQCVDSLVKNRDIRGTDLFARSSGLGRVLVSIVTIYIHIFLICWTKRTLVLSSDSIRVKEKTSFKSLGFKESDWVWCWTYKWKNRVGVRGWLGTENLRSCVYEVLGLPCSYGCFR